METHISHENETQNLHRTEEILIVFEPSGNTQIMLNFGMIYSREIYFTSD